jgi:hypothetical protein
MRSALERVLPTGTMINVGQKHGGSWDLFGPAFRFVGEPIKVVGSRT